MHNNEVQSYIVLQLWPKVFSVHIDFVHNVWCSLFANESIWNILNVSVIHQNMTQSKKNIFKKTQAVNLIL